MRYFTLLELLVFLVVNYAAIKVSILLINLPNDGTVLAGIVILAFLLLADVDIVRLYLKKRRKNEVVSKSN